MKTLAPNVFIAFSCIPINDDFISPEGSLCRKLNDSQAIMLDSEDSAYKVGEKLPFVPSEIVEFVTRF